MNGDILIAVDSVTKHFAASLTAQRRALRQRLLRRFLGARPPAPSGFAALSEVSLTVRRGEAVALLGHNGAGKSTLLRMIAGHSAPDAGTVSVHRNRAELFDLGTGFEPTLTGRQNIALVGTLRGMRRAEIEAKADEIAAFTELGERLDTPFGGFSQGMKMRLGFAIAAHAAPDVLLIDEVLGVGDLRFRNKCYALLDRLKPQVATVLVTHSLGDAARFCDRGVVLEKGRVVFDGDVREAVARYREGDGDGAAANAGPVLETGAVRSVDAAWSQERFGPFDPLRLSLRIDVTDPVSAFGASVLLYTDDGVPLLDLPQAGAQRPLASGLAAFGVSVEPTGLAGGRYTPVLALRDGAALIHRAPLPDLVIDQGGMGAWGMLNARCRWERQAPGEETSPVPRRGGAR